MSTSTIKIVVENFDRSSGDAFGNTQGDMTLAVSLNWCGVSSVIDNISPTVLKRTGKTEVPTPMLVIPDIP